MPALPEASKYLEKLQKDLGFKIHIFSHRPWPQKKQKGGKGFRWLMRRIYPYPCLRLWPRPFLKPAIWRITKKWLKEKKIMYDHILIEEGRIYSSNSQVASRNRYVMAAKKMIPIFVEDMTHNAVRLSDICELVFLIRHPYNSRSEEGLPKNVIPVDGWKDIYHFIRDNF